MPLLSGVCPFEAVHLLLKKQNASDLFRSAFAPEAALGGLWLYFGCFEECHKIVQDIDTPEGSFWHAILHRQEPDAGNSAYWFRRVGDHPVFPALHRSADEIIGCIPQSGFRLHSRWDPFAFIDFCERARQHPGSPIERCALEIQRAEWQLLFDYCARTRA